MALPALNYVVVDANQLRVAPTVAALVGEYRATGQRIVLPWVHLYEQSKTRDAAGFDRVHENLRAEPDAAMLAKPSSLIVQAEHESGRPQHDLAEIEEPRNGAAFRAYLADPRRTIDISKMADGVEEMFHSIHKPGWAGLLLTGVTVDDPAISKAIHKGLGVGDRGPLRASVVGFCGEGGLERTLRGLLTANNIPPDDAVPLVRYPSMIALTILTTFCLGLRWKHQTPKKEHEDNPACDSEAVLIALYGRRLVTADNIARDLDEDMRIIAREVWP